MRRPLKEGESMCTLKLVYLVESPTSNLSDPSYVFCTPSFLFTGVSFGMGRYAIEPENAAKCKLTLGVEVCNMNFDGYQHARLVGWT